MLKILLTILLIMQTTPVYAIKESQTDNQKDPPKKSLIKKIGKGIGKGLLITAAIPVFATGYVATSLLTNSWGGRRPQATYPQGISPAIPVGEIYPMFPPNYNPGNSAQVELINAQYAARGGTPYFGNDPNAALIHHTYDTSFIMSPPLQMRVAQPTTRLRY